MERGNLDVKIPKIRIAIQFENCFFKRRSFPEKLEMIGKKLKIAKPFLPALYPFDKNCIDILYEWASLDIWVALISFVDEKMEKKYRKMLRGTLFDELIFCPDPGGLGPFLQREGPYSYYIDSDMDMIRLCGMKAIQFKGWGSNYLI